MSWSKVAPLPVGAATLVAVLLLLPAVSTAEETLLIRLPLNLDGDVTAQMTAGAVAIAADPQVPHFDMLFTAAKARIVVTNFSSQEVHNTPSDLPRDLDIDGLVDRPQGGSEDLTPEDVEDVTFEFRDLTEQFLFVLYDGAQSGATYQAQALETPARLDLSHDATRLSYTDDPQGLDFRHDLAPNAFKLSSPGMRYEVKGDFTFMLHGGDMLALSPQSYVPTVKTGTSTSTESVSVGPLDQPVTTTTKTQYVRVEVTDAVLTVAASGGAQQMYAHTENIQVDVNGAMRSGAAAGGITYNNESIRASGDGFGATGQFQLTPIYVPEDSDNKEVIFVIGGGFDSLSVGDATYTKDVIAAAAVSLGGLISLLGVGYLWKSGLLVPLYAKLTKAKVLDQSTRQQVHHKVESDPGCQVKQVAESLDISWTTASYHLRVLRKMDLVIAKRQGRHEHFFAAGSRAAQSHAVVAALQNRTAKQIVELVLLNPGIIQKDLCERLGIAASTASGHLSKLRDIGALSEEREWKKRRYFAGPALQSLPVQFNGVEHGGPAAEGVMSAT